MFKKRQRLTKKEFDLAFKSGKRSHSPALQLIHDASSGDFHGAVVVGKKVYKKAVDRNRLRRRIYGLLYRFNKEHKLTGTFILITKPAVRDLTKKELKETVNDLLVKQLRQ